MLLYPKLIIGSVDLLDAQPTKNLAPPFFSL